MATVMITKELLRSIQTRVSKAHQAEVKEACPLMHQQCTIDASELFNQTCWGEHLHLLREIPKGWLKEAVEAPIRCTAPPGTLHPELDFVTNVYFSGMRSAYWRPTPAVGSYYPNPPAVDLTWDQLHERQHLPGAQHCIERLREAKTAHEIQEKYKALQRQLDDFLGRCRSLNEAVKAMPSIRLYLDAGYIDRLDRKVERNKKVDRADELLEGVDVDAVTSVGAAALLGGSS